MKATAVLLAKERRSWLTRWKHRMMLKVYQNYWSLSPELNHTFDTSRDFMLQRMDTTEGEAQAGKYVTSEMNQFDASFKANSVVSKSRVISMTPMEAYESGQKPAPGEMQFVLPRKCTFYDADTKSTRFTVAPFWWNMIPGDEGLQVDTASYYTGDGTRQVLEPTIDNMLHGDNKGETFLPATPEEAAELEAEQKYERDVRNSMMKAVADLNIVEVPPYYIMGQRTWNNVMPWYKAKAAKGTLTQQEESSQSWDMLVAWKDKA
eukprot:TRINITY_DN1062_c1_g2_i1.p1 TRINITY_DN1062_c1_g2~~TRINITY_DN1062_c1_g2_i1.p1  ORF type:complete len:263 (+),score=65.29 TRINITY_DN1062_c1_g2_i1:62-850(+)